MHPSPPLPIFFSPSPPLPIPLLLLFFSSPRLFWAAPFPSPTTPPLTVFFPPPSLPPAAWLFPSSSSRMLLSLSSFHIVDGERGHIKGYRNLVAICMICGKGLCWQHTDDCCDDERPDNCLRSHDNDRITLHPEEFELPGVRQFAGRGESGRHCLARTSPPRLVVWFWHGASR
jgi:hypothetical protein